MKTQEVFIVSMARTPIGKMGGALKTLTVLDLSTQVILSTIERGRVSPEDIDEIVMGETRPSAEIHNVARNAALMAKLPENVTGYTIQQGCSSGMCAIQNAASKIALGIADAVIAGGVESMSNAPYYLRNIRYGAGIGDVTLYDSIIGSQFGAQPEALYGKLSMGMTAEILAEQHHITREEQDTYAHQSQQRYFNALIAGKFKEEIVPLLVPQHKADPLKVEMDEQPRLSSVERLGALKPVFKENGTVTAGNSCGRNDGACTILLVSERKIKYLGVNPIARIVGYDTVGVSPREMGIGPVPVVNKLLSRLGLKMIDIDFIELNEAFAAQVLVCANELQIDKERLNVNGGAIAVGHPGGMTGARLIGTLALELQRHNKAKYGLATLCVGGGMGSAVIIEKL